MLSETLTLIGVPVARSVLGWLENAFEDGVISRLEWSQLVSTVFRMGTIGAGLHFGLDLEAFAAAGAALVADFFFKAIKKRE